MRLIRKKSSQDLLGAENKDESWDVGARATSAIEIRSSSIRIKSSVYT